MDLVDELGRSEPASQARTLATQPVDVATAVFRALEPRHQGRLLGRLPGERIAELLSALSPGDRVRALTTVSDARASDLLALLPQGERRITEQLLRYPEESAGRMMTPRYLTLRGEQTRAEALELLRRAVAVDNPYTLPVLDAEGRPEGLVRLGDLIAAADGATARDVMVAARPTVSPADDQELAARLVLESRQLAVPVVDEGRLVGLVTVEDAMEVLDLEDAEDTSRSAASEPLGQPYFSAPVVGIARGRGMWLLVLAVAATLTVSVLELFEDELAQVVALALFIPLLIGTGGNAGAQATTTVVRAMALGEVRFRDVPRVIGRELRVGLVLGGMLGALAVVPVVVLYDGRMAATVALTLVSICSLATLVGSVFPVLARRIGLDPAVVSAPFIATFVDATGLLVYFTYAKAILGL